MESIDRINPFGDVILPYIRKTGDMRSRSGYGIVSRIVLRTIDFIKFNTGTSSFMTCHVFTLLLRLETIYFHSSYAKNGSVFYSSHAKKKATIFSGCHELALNYSLPYSSMYF